MSVLIETESLYEVLGIPRMATPDDIRIAYFRQVRAYPPRQHPDFFQKLNAAYGVLGDGRRRAAYDQESDNGRRVQVLVDQAAVAAERDPQKAMSLLKNAVVLAPDMTRPRGLLAHVLMRIEEYASAERQYRWLLQLTPHDESLRFRLARCLWLQEKREAAEQELHEALRLNPGFHDALALLARLYAESRQGASQIETLERAIANDGQENYADFDALLQLFVLHARRGDLAALGHTERRLQAILPPAKAATAAREMIQRAERLLEAGETIPGREMVRCAAAIPLPDDAQETAMEIASAARRNDLAAEARQILRDSLLSRGLQGCFEVLYLDRSKDVIRQSRMEAAFALIQREIEEDSRTLIQRIDYLRCEYPGIAAEQESFLSQLRLRAVKRQEAPIRATSSLPVADPAPPIEPPRRAGLLGRLLGGAH